MKFKVFKFKKIKSTNTTAIRIIKNSNIQNGMVISELQTGGRGQYGKKWISYKGNLLISFFYSLKNLKLSYNKLTKLNCFLVKKFISIYYKKKINYKKPNDLLIDKKKISGILQETVSKFNHKYLVVGIGINLIKSPKIQNYSTTNLYEITKKKIFINKALNEIKEIFEKKLSKHEK